MTQGSGSAGELQGLLGPSAKVVNNGTNAIQNVIDGLYDAAIAGPMSSQIEHVMRLGAIATSFKTSFFALPQIMTRSNAMYVPIDCSTVGLLFVFDWCTDCVCLLIVVIEFGL